MTTLFLSHPDCHAHELTSGHPESPERIAAIETAIDGISSPHLIKREASKAEKEHILLAHKSHHWDFIEATIPERENELKMISGDTGVNHMSLQASLRATGAAISSVNEIMADKAQNAFCNVRPPGHHATPDSAMGFCIFNSAAIAAKYARATFGLSRVAVVDFDVHHGNGTQDIFWNEPDLFFGSTHQIPLYPGSGHINETGVDNIFNAPLSPGADGRLFKEAMNDKILPALMNFAPDLLIISAGFDAHRADPVGGLNLLEEDFEWATFKLAEIAHQHANGRIISLLEGGYDVEALAQSAKTHINALIESGH